MASLNDVSGLSGQSRAAYLNLLKIQYASMWDDWVHKAPGLFAEIAPKKGTMGGQYTKAAVITGYPQSVAIASREGVRLPAPEVGTYINPELISRQVYSLLRWTGDVERAARAGNAVAFAKPREQDLKDARRQFDIEMDIKAILGMAEVRGKIATGGVSGATITLESRNSRNASSFWNSGRHLLRVNKHVGAAATARGVPHYEMEVTSGSESSNDRKISSVGGTDAAPTITLNSAFPAGPTDGSHIIPFKSRALSGWTGTAADEISLFASFNGAFDIATDSTIASALYGLAKSSNALLSGVYRSNPAGAGTTRPFQERLVTLMVDLIRDNGTGNEPDLLYLHSATRREVLAEHESDRQYAPILGASGFQQLVAHVGDKALPYKSDFLMLPGMVMALTKDCWGWIEQSPLGPIDMTSERTIEGYDAHEIVWHKSGNIECQRPFDQGILDDIDFDVTDINV